MRMQYFEDLVVIKEELGDLGSRYSYESQICSDNQKDLAMLSMCIGLRYWHTITLETFKWPTY